MLRVDHYLSLSMSSGWVMDRKEIDKAVQA